jgi:putative transposase
MTLSRSTFYKGPREEIRRNREELRASLRVEIEEVLTEWPSYGYRRVTRELRRRGIVANHKRVARIMREEALTPRRVRRFITTTDSGHGNPVYPNLAGDILPTGPDQLWVADLTYIRLRKEFVFLSVLLDAWSRKVVGYALSRYLDVRLTLAALEAAVASRRPGPGLIHHSDRGSQYASKQYRERLEALGIQGSMGRTGNPYDNAKVESFFKTLKQEEVYAFEYETMQDVLERLPTFLEETYNCQRLHSSLGYVPPEEYERVYAKTEGQIPEPFLSTRWGSLQSDKTNSVT